LTYGNARRLQPSRRNRYDFASRLAKVKPSKTLGIEPRWAFFETIDEDLHEYSRYLYFHRDNLKAYSVNLARLYLSICSEIDVLLKVICAGLVQPASSSAINQYQPVISKQFPDIRP
jgi:hypothetical protein